jgi:ATP synthase F1 complex assembly factor 2
MLRWLKKSYNIEIKPVSEGIPSKIRHPKESVEKIEWLLKEMDPYTLACFQCVTIECKSLIMALAVLFRRVSLADIRKYSRLEEEFSIEVWGLVEGGHDMDRINNAVGLSSAMLYLGLHLDPTQLAAMEARWAEKCAQ